MHRTLLAALIIVLVSVARLSPAGIQVAGELLVDLDTAGLDAGPLAAWPNAGTLKGEFRAGPTPPVVREVSGHRVAFFDGSAHLASTAPAPATITGDESWSLEVWAFKHDFGQRESTLVSWAPRGLAAGHTAQFSWGENNLAAIHWALDLAWRQRPAAGAWQHLAITYGDGVERLYVNGRLDQQSPRALRIAAGHPILVGAAASGRGTESGFVGAIAAVRIHSDALTEAQVRANCDAGHGTLPPIPPAAPAIAAGPAAGVRPTSAYLSAQLTATGGAPTLARAYWGPEDGGTQAQNWASSATVGPRAIGALFHPVTNLAPGRTYCYRFSASNAVGAAWTARAATFTTRPLPAADPAARRSFRLVVWPDSQNAVDAWPAVVGRMADWVVARRDAEDIRYVIHVGDMVQTGADEQQWQRFDAAFARLEGRVPYILAVGNHDLDRSSPRRTALFNRYFPPARLAKQAGYGGSFPEGASDSSYHTFHAAGRDWLIVSLRYEPAAAELEWGNAIIARHPGHIAIVATHSYLTHTGRDRSGERIWDALVRRHRNILCVFCGHLSTVHYQGVGDHGNTVYELLFDWQNSEKVDNNTYLALVEFDLDARRIVVESYSPVLDRFFTDPLGAFVLENVAFPEPPGR